jgi:hypothetical protein
VVCEGAIDRFGTAIRAEDVRALIESDVGVEARVTGVRVCVVVCVFVYCLTGAMCVVLAIGSVGSRAARRRARASRSADRNTDGIEGTHTSVHVLVLIARHVCDRLSTCCWPSLPSRCASACRAASLW